MSAQKQNHFYVHKEYLKMTTIKIRFELYVSVDKIHLEKWQTIEKFQFWIERVEKNFKSKYVSIP